MIEAVIFDMDGVLIDSEHFWRRAEIEVFEHVGVFLTEEDCLKTLGYRIDEVEEYWFERRPWPREKPGLVSDAIVDKMVEYVLSEGKPMAGVHEAIELFISQKLALGLASSSPKRLIDAVLKRLEILDHFNAVCSAEFEPFGKPHPAVFMTCAAQLGTTCDKTIIIEDSPSGIIAAKAAKAVVIAVPEVLNRDKPEMACAHLTINTLTDLNFNNLNLLLAI